MFAFAAFVFGASISLVLTPLVRRLAYRCGALDHPDGMRKLQATPVPHLGGLAIFVALAAGAVVVWQTQPQSSLAPGLLASAACMCLIGWYDDRFALRVRWKLLGQIAATLPVVISGQSLSLLECCGCRVDVGWCGIPLSMVWLVAGANAINFLDGVDGLATTLGLIAAAMMCAIACCLGNTDAMLLAAVLAGALAGFWRFNWRPASIYLGDAGSMTIGLWLAALAMAGSRGGAQATRLVVPAALLAVPLSDVCLAVIRRVLAGRAFWLPDRGHIHHRLAERGWSVGQTVGVLAAISAASGTLALAAAANLREDVVWGVLVGGAIALIRFKLIGADEMELVVQWLAKRLHALDNRASLRRPLNTGHVTRDLPNTG
ncbi:MAG TPA: MraY family glycosyltransferase [Pirellulales bacterium]